MDSPITRNDKDPSQVSGLVGHVFPFQMAQNTSCKQRRQRIDLPSTAENQKLSSTCTPTPQRTCSHDRPAFGGACFSEGSAIIFFAKCVMLQKRSKW